jgi:hypothetical protein
MFFYEKQIKAKKKTILSNYVLFHMYSRHIHVEDMLKTGDKGPNKIWSSPYYSLFQYEPATFILP